MILIRLLHHWPPNSQSMDPPYIFNIIIFLFLEHLYWEFCFDLKVVKNIYLGFTNIYMDVLKENSISKKQEILNSQKVIGYISLTTGIC